MYIRPYFDFTFVVFNNFGEEKSIKKKKIKKNYNKTQIKKNKTNTQKTKTKKRYKTNKTTYL